MFKCLEVPKRPDTIHTRRYPLRFFETDCPGTHGVLLRQNRRSLQITHFLRSSNNCTFLSIATYKALLSAVCYYFEPQNKLYSLCLKSHHFVQIWKLVSSIQKDVDKSVIMRKRIDWNWAELLADWTVMAFCVSDCCLRVTGFSYTIYLFVSPSTVVEKLSLTSGGKLSVRTLRHCRLHFLCIV
jgi:hypothetical protein